MTTLIRSAHTFSYVAVADDLVPRFIAWSCATIVTTGCSVHSEMLQVFLFEVIMFKYWHILCGTTGHSVPLHRLYLTCVVISGPGLESNQDTKCLSVITRNCRSGIYYGTPTHWGEWVAVGNEWIAIESCSKSLGFYSHIQIMCHWSLDSIFKAERNV